GEQGLDRAGRRQVERADDGDHLPHMVRIVVGQIARQHPSETDSHEADMTFGELAHVCKPSAQSAEKTRRRSPVDAQLPSQCAVSAPLQEHPQAPCHQIRCQKSRKDKNDAVLAMRKTSAVRQRRTIGEGGKSISPEPPIWWPPDRSAAVETSCQSAHPEENIAERGQAARLTAWGSAGTQSARRRRPAPAGGGGWHRRAWRPLPPTRPARANIR